MSHLLAGVDAASLRTDVPDFRPGDNVKVHVNIIEGTRSRVLSSRASSSAARATAFVRPSRFAR